MVTVSSVTLPIPSGLGSQVRWDRHRLGQLEAFDECCSLQWICTAEGANEFGTTKFGHYLFRGCTCLIYLQDSLPKRAAVANCQRLGSRLPQLHRDNHSNTHAGLQSQEHTLVITVARSVAAAFLHRHCCSMTVTRLEPAEPGSHKKIVDGQRFGLHHRHNDSLQDFFCLGLCCCHLAPVLIVVRALPGDEGEEAILPEDCTERHCFSGAIPSCQHRIGVRLLSALLPIVYRWQPCFLFLHFFGLQRPTTSRQ